MDNIIEALIDKRYEDVIENFSKSDISDDSIINVFVHFYNLFIKEEISRDEYFLVNYTCLLGLGDNVDITDKILDNINDDDISNMINIFKKYIMLDYNLQSIIDIINSSINKKIKSNDINKDNLLTFLKEILAITNSHNCMEFNIYVSQESPSLIHNNETEIHNRLRLIVKTFGIKFLIFLNVDLIDYSTYQDMSYRQKVGYYTKTLMRLNNGIQKIILFYDQFIEVNKKFDELYDIYKNNIALNDIKK